MCAEDIARDRIGIYDKSGSHLFKKGFEGDKSLFHWNDLDGDEQAGKAGLFVAVFLAYRNPRFTVRSSAIHWKLCASLC